MRVDPRERFTKAAELYARYRPSYPDAAVDWILATAGPGAAVVDLGCGTGIASRLLAARGLDVVGIDPNQDMLAHARAAGGGPRYLHGEASATGLPDASVDLAVAAQAFHWFDFPATFAELRRILRRDRWVVALWNQRGVSPLTDAYEQVLLAHSGEYRELATHADTIARLRAVAGTRAVTEAEFVHVEVLDWERFWGRTESSSYVAHGIDDRDAFARELRALFARHADDGKVVWPYQTELIALQLM